MKIEDEVLRHANKNGNPYATLIDAGFLLYEARMIMHGFASCLDIGDLVKFVSESIRDERTNIMTSIDNRTFDSCLGKEFVKKGSGEVYRFCTLGYGAGQSIEIVGEFDSDGFMTAVINDPDIMIEKIASGEIVEVAEISKIH